jgi:5-(carboxyamino)imidazole ribonucleotide mutase
MPGGVPVGTLAIGASGAKNAALMAIRILALDDDQLRRKLEEFHQKQTQGVLDDVIPRNS